MKKIRMSEKAWKRTAAAFFFLFFIIAYKCSGQDRPMRFSTQDEVMYVGVKNGAIFVYFQRDKTSDYTISIGYPNGQFDYLTGGIAEEGVRIYPISADVSNRLKTQPFDVMLFESKEKKYICAEIQSRDYFLSRLK